MPQNFIACDREQVWLLPPSVRDWLPEDHLAWTVLDAVAELDLTAFYSAYRSDGHGRPAYEPSMVVALLLYAYARGNRSSRRIERACVEDVAYRVIAGNLVPDHSTIAEFRARHEVALAELFGGVLGLCAKVGLVSVGVIAIDGTKVLANASHERNLDYRQVAERILAEAERIDREEDELYGEARGDELPEQLRTAEGRRAALRRAKEELEREQAAGEVEGESDLELEFDSERVGQIRGRGRRGWSTDARRQLDEHRRRQKRPVVNDRQERLLEARRRLVEQHLVEIEANRRYELWYSGRDPNGVKKPRSGPGLSSWAAPAVPEGRINLTDPDSRVMQSTQRWVQGYNAQSAVTPGQIMVAAEISVLSPDFGQLEPMVQAAERELEKAGVSAQPEVVVADAGYWHTNQMQRLAARGIPALIPPDANTRQGQRPGWSGGFYAFMRRVLASDAGHQLYRQRQILVEPVFGHTKHNRKIDRFMRRGRSAVHSEWRLIGATHNLLKLHHHMTAPAATG